MWNDAEVTITNFYGMTPPNAEHMKKRLKRVAVIIQQMGDKYCLATPVERKTDAK